MNKPEVTKVHRALAINRKSAFAYAEKKGVKATQKLLREAAADLRERIAQADIGPGRSSFTAAQMRATLAQITDTIKALTQKFAPVLIDAAKIAAEVNAQHTIDYLTVADKAFRGIGSTPLSLDSAAIMDRAVKGSQSSLLRLLASNPYDPIGVGILQRYGMETIGEFEDILRRSVLSRATIGEVRDMLIAESPFLQGKPEWWAERIARTELMRASNVANLTSIAEANEQLGDMVKILAATFDQRTCADSYAVHGQVRKVESLFDTWQGPHAYPPARPNDREIVVPHRLRWEIPPYLRARPAGEVAFRWFVHEHHKKPHPAIPLINSENLPLVYAETSAP